MRLINVCLESMPRFNTNVTTLLSVIVLGCVNYLFKAVSDQTKLFIYIFMHWQAGTAYRHNNLYCVTL